MSQQSFLRIPPFPGAKVRRLAPSGFSQPHSDGLADALRTHRVGGSYWRAQPQLPASYVLATSLEAVRLARSLDPNGAIVFWDQAGDAAASAADSNAVIVRGDCDPWHMIEGASALMTADPANEVRLIARLKDVPTHLLDRSSGKTVVDREPLADLLARSIGPHLVECPFTGRAMSVHDMIELCGHWRRLIDSNRGISGGLGFAFWKQDQVAALLWDGSAPFQFFRSTDRVAPNQAVAIWRAKADAAVIDELERRKTPLIEVEDGFLRSRGLGADCIPPLSITVDRLGPYFDPAQPSELESLLEKREFDDRLLTRARDLRRAIVDAGIGKYEQGGDMLERLDRGRRHILVTGQVEDDRAVVLGGGGLTSNLELLRRVRAGAAGAYILYKPHPDVVAGHRRGAISDAECLEVADRIVSDAPIAPLIEMVDEVHVNTSLAGFEALLRGKGVTTYGVPFYAGWGLTDDRGAVPSRRTRRLSIDELVAAALLIYPRYLDPVTGLPCPAEILVARLSNMEPTGPGMLVGVRRLQGKIMRNLRRLVQ